jgi:hypothetical protein
MALQLGAVLAAFRAADVPDDVAQRAAEELAGYENRFRDLETTMTTGFGEMRLGFERVQRQFVDLEAKVVNQGASLEAKIESQVAALEAKIERQGAALQAKIERQGLSLRAENSLNRWMVTFVLGLSLLMLGRLFGVIHG